MGITSNILTSETRALIDANLVEAYREFGRWQRSSQLVEKNGILLVAGTTSFPYRENARAVCGWSLSTNPVQFPEKA